MAIGNWQLALRQAPFGARRLLRIYDRIYDRIERQLAVATA